MLKLRVRDVDLNQGIITIRQGKFRKDRLVPPALPLVNRLRKYAAHFENRPPAAILVIEAGSVKTLALPPRSPNLNAYAERWVRSVKEECLAKLILLGEGSLRRALRHYEVHYYEERNHQGKENVLLFPLPTQVSAGERERCGVESGWAAC